MARIAIKSNADRQIVLCRDDRGFFLQTIHSDEKKPIEERVVTIGEAKQFYDRADEKAEKFAAVPYDLKETVEVRTGIHLETTRSIQQREQYEMRPRPQKKTLQDIEKDCIGRGFGEIFSGRCNNETECDDLQILSQTHNYGFHFR